MHATHRRRLLRVGLVCLFLMGCGDTPSDEACPDESASCVEGADTQSPDMDACDDALSCPTDALCPSRCDDEAEQQCPPQSALCAPDEPCAEDPCSDANAQAAPPRDAEARSGPSESQDALAAPDTSETPEDDLGPVPTGPMLSIGRSELLSDSNADGALSPGESATVGIYIINQGDMPAEGVWVLPTEIDMSVTGLSCAVEDALCAEGCLCEGVASSQTIPPGATGLVPSLTMTFTLPLDAPLTPITLGFTLHDAAGQSWDSEATIELAPYGAQLGVSHAHLAAESSGDGFLAPGESAALEISAENSGTSGTEGVILSVQTSSPHVQLTACEVPHGGAWLPCELPCYCHDVVGNKGVTLPAGETSAGPLLRVSFLLSEGAPIAPITWDVVLHDALGHTWHDLITTPVHALGPSLSLSTFELVDDSNGDGVLSAGESASLRFFAQNDGTEAAKEVWAELLTLDPAVSLIGCYAQEGAGWTACDDACSCEDIPEVTQDLKSGESGDEALLRVDFELPETGAPLSLVFGVALTDKRGVTWSDALTLDLAPQ